jgi:hypothetical protein
MAPRIQRARSWNFDFGSLKCSICRIAPSIAPFPAMESLLWLLLEAGVALALLIFIVWWTWPRRRPEDKPDSDDSG